MLHNSNRIIQDADEYVSPTIDAGRLRFEYDRLQQCLTALHGRSGAELESNALRSLVIHIARDLGSIHTDSLKAVESKFTVALDMASEHIDQTPRVLFVSALSDLRYLILMREPRMK